VVFTRGQEGCCVYVFTGVCVCVCVCVFSGVYRVMHWPVVLSDSVQIEV
jgi:hypothetical protein